MKSLISRVLACALPGAFWFCPHAVAAPGDWDRSFAQDGHLALQIPGVTFTVRDWLQQPDGKFVIVGHTTVDAALAIENKELILARFNASGTPDTSFDGDGYVRFDFPTIAWMGTANLARQSDGKLLVVAQAGDDYNEARLLRFNANGSRDAGYGTNGEVSISYPTSTTILNPMFRLAPDGAAIVVGRFWVDTLATLPESIVATRVTSSGTIDTTFGTAGNAFLRGTDHLFPETMEIAADGTIVIGGTIGPFNNSHPIVGRLTSAGQPAAFGTNGIVEVPFLAGEGYMTSVAVTAGNKVMAAGVRNDASGNLMNFIARFNVDGTLDPTFGSGGRIISAGSISSILVEADGKVVGAGAIYDRFAAGFLGRYNSDGSPDQTFATRGISRTEFTTGNEVVSNYLSHVKRNADGSYSALVQIYAPLSTSFELVRFLAQGSSAGVLGIYAETEASAGFSVYEETPTQTFHVIRTGGTEGAVSIQYRTVSDTAIAGQDFVAKTGTVTLNDGETTASFDVQINDDAISENNFSEDFHVELFGPTGGAGLSKYRATIRLSSDFDFGQRIQVMGDTGKFLEGGTARVLIYRSGDMRGPLAVNYTITAGTALAGSDYTGTGGTVQWPADEGGAREFSVPLVNNGIAESPEQFTITFADIPGVPQLAPLTITITDDDDNSVPAIAFASNVVYVDENAGSATFTVRRFGDASQALSIPWGMASCSGFGTASPPQDYANASGTLTWSAGESGSKSFSIPIVDDSIFELIESCAAFINPTYPLQSLNDTNAALVIKDNDGTPGQAVASLGGATVVSESAGTISVPVTLSGLPAGPLGVSVDWQVYGGTASQNDLTSAYGTLVWENGDHSTRTISVPITSDSRDETNETFWVTLGRPQYGVSIGNARQQFTITDDDPTPAGQSAPVPPGVEVVSAVTVNESQQTATVELRRVGETTFPLSTYIYTEDGTAGSPGDYFLPYAFADWNANETATKRIEVQINGDGVIEPTETLTIYASADLEGGTPVSIPITITDDDAPAPPARVGLISPTVSVSESAATVSVQVGRTGNTAVASSVDYAATAGTAGATDFTAANGTLTWAANDASSKTITITLLPDTVDEADETFSITLSNTSSGTQLDTATATVTIQDDDVPVTTPPPSGGSSSSSGGGKKGGGGGAEGYLDLLLLAAALGVARRRGRLVERKGIEPSTFALRTRRSPI